MSNITEQIAAFLDALKAKGFYAQYVGDAEGGDLIPSCHTPDVVATIQKLSPIRICFSDVNDSGVGFVDFSGESKWYSETNGTEDFQIAVGLALGEAAK